jgi:CDP-glycerol glycerophosphotransferase (TagB/SpsB family)
LVGKKTKKINFLIFFYFKSVLPFESALYVIDIFFLDGIKVLFQLALTILNENRQSLLECHDDGDAIMILTSYLDTIKENENNEKKIFYLIEKSYKDYNDITEEDINHLRLKHRLKVIQNMNEALLQSAARNTLKYTSFTEQEIKNIFYIFKVKKKNKIFFD